MRCEFTADDDSEAFLISSAFIPQPQVSMALVVQYNISSPNTAVELFIVSHRTHQVIQRHSLSHQKIVYIANIPSTADPVYVVLNAYRVVSTTASSRSSVILKYSYLATHTFSQQLIFCYFAVYFTVLHLNNQQRKCSAGILTLSIYIYIYIYTCI